MKHCVLIELDAILDTRLGILNMIDPSIAIEALENGWRTRQHNDVSVLTDKITNEEYKKLWEERNEEVLVHSRPTTFIFELTRMAQELEENIVLDKGRIDDGCFIINFYPYTKLTVEEKNDIISIVKGYVGDAIPVKHTCIEPTVLELGWLKENNILTYVVNDYGKWFNEAMHPSKGQKCMVPYPKLTVIAPSVMDNKDGLKNLTAADKDLIGKQSPFHVFTIFWAPLLGIQFYPVELFSVLDLSILREDG